MGDSKTLPQPGSRRRNHRKKENKYIVLLRMFLVCHPFYTSFVLFRTFFLLYLIHMFIYTLQAVVEEMDVPANVPFHISRKYKAILTQLVNSLKSTIPYGRPALLDYFTDDYEKIKIAEALAFCGDVGSYLIALTDIREDIRDVFIDLLRVSGTVVCKTATKKALRDADKKLVCCVIYFPK